MEKHDNDGDDVDEEELSQRGWPDQEEEEEQEVEENLLGKGSKTKHVDGKDLPSSQFAYVGDPDNPATWHLPVHDASHVQNATSRFNQADMPDTGKKHRAAVRIVHEAGKHGINADGFKEQYVKTLWPDVYKSALQAGKSDQRILEFADLLMLSGSFAGKAAASAASTVGEESTSMKKATTAADDLLGLVEKSANPEIKEMGKHLRQLYGMAKSAHDITQDLDPGPESRRETESGLGMAGAIKPEKMVKSIVDGVQANLEKSFGGRVQTLEERLNEHDKANESLLKAVNALLRAQVGPEDQQQPTAVEKTAVRVVPTNHTQARPVDRGTVDHTPTNEEIELAKSDPTGRKQRELFLRMPVKVAEGPCPINTLQY
jgi:hypothetical protein